MLRYLKPPRGCPGFRPDPQLTRGLVGWWNFNEPSTTLLLASHNSWNALQRTEGLIATSRYGRAWQFDGSNDKAWNATLHPTMDAAAAATFFALACPLATAASSHYIMSLPEDGAGGNATGLFQNGSNWGWLLTTHGGGDSGTGPAIAGVGKCQSLALSYDGVTARFYVDGVQRDSGAVTVGAGLKAAMDYVMFGCYSTGLLHWNGKLALGGLWLRGLTGGEIGDLHRATGRLTAVNNFLRGAA